MKNTLLISVFFVSVNAIAAASYEEVHSLLTKYYQLDDGCRGIADAKTSCNLRNSLAQRLHEKGWCYEGPREDSIEADKSWQPCKFAGNAGTIRSSNFELTDAVRTAAKAANLSTNARTVSGESDSSGYSLTVTYDADINTETDTYRLAASFVQYLVSVGRDPTDSKNRRSVHVCALQDGLTTASGKPGVKLLGCSHFNPYKDVITQD